MSNTTQGSIQDPDGNYNGSSQTSHSIGFGYGLGLSLGILTTFLLIAYGASYLCKWWMQRISTIPRSNQHSNSSITIPIDDNSSTIITTRIKETSRGLDEATLFSYPQYIYSQLVKLHKSDDSIASACSVCLADYKENDLLRLLPNCNHIFHLSCIDAWLIRHPTCPICRYSPIISPIPRFPSTLAPPAHQSPAV